RLWFYDPLSFSARKAIFFWTIVAHAAAMAFFFTHDGIILTSWISAGLSLIVFIVLWLKVFKQAQPLLGAALILALVIHPWEVFADYAKNAREFQCVLPRGHVKPQFSWIRPVEEAKSDCKIFKFVRYESFYNSMAMQDARGFIGFPVNVTRGVFLLSQWIEEKVLIEFTRYKLFLYDHVVRMDEEPLNVRMLGDIFINTRNAAYLIKPDAGKEARFNAEDWAQSPLTALQGPSSLADVSSFDVNHLKLNLNLPEKKFLVYTDGYTRFWKVFINGRPETLIRANVGFKGVWVPAGKNSVEFRYQPPGGGAAYAAVSIVLFGFLLGLIFLLFRERNWPWVITE
ncbi:MAG: YfhO family protein, partial [Candidatus Omnitrophica bacterium]|nr:YfhO family protein [Candidatus Omnitrophota bacterium]